MATHLFYLDDAKRLLREGSDLVAHSIRDADVDAEHPSFFDNPFLQRWADPREVASLSTRRRPAGR